MKKILAIILLINALSSCISSKHAKMYTKKWKGSDVPGHTYASFEKLYGGAVFPMEGVQHKFYVLYDIRTQEGKMNFKIRQNNGKVLFSKRILGESRDSIVISSTDINPCYIIVSGFDSAGSFDIKYGSLSNTIN